MRNYLHQRSINDDLSKESTFINSEKISTRKIHYKV